MNTLTGVWGEVYAARYLRDNGYSIRAANYQTRMGEVDVIAERDGVTVFVEVKTRSAGMLARPMESVTVDKQRRLTLAAKQYLRLEPTTAAARFDVIEVYLDDGQKPVRIEHIPNAFEAESN